MRRTLGSLTVVALLMSACVATPTVTGTQSPAASPTATPTVAPAPPCAPYAQPAPPSTLAGTIAIERFGQQRRRVPNLDLDRDLNSRHDVSATRRSASRSTPSRVGVGAHGV